jgi:hypothetical protein
MAIVIVDIRMKIMRRPSLKGFCAVEILFNEIYMIGRKQMSNKMNLPICGGFS